MWGLGLRPAPEGSFRGTRIASVPEVAETTTAPAGRKVLAVEDEAVSRLLLVRSLQQWGYQVLEASDGARALELFEREEPALIITDWQMPDVDGLELCRRIRASKSAAYAYIVVLTARTEKGDAVAALQAGADEFLTKPIDRAELRARVNTAERILGLEEALGERVQKLEETLALLRSSQVRLIEAERLAAVGAVSITVKHEVNNPLTGIIGLAELCLLDAATGPPPTMDALRRIAALGRDIAAKIKRIEQVGQFRTTEYLPGQPGTPMLDTRGPT